MYAEALLDALRCRRKRRCRGNCFSTYLLPLASYSGWKELNP